LCGDLATSPTEMQVDLGTAADLPDLTMLGYDLFAVNANE